MAGRIAAGASQLRRSLSLTGAIVTLSVGVLLPVLLSTSVGIVALVIGTSTRELLIGVLVVSFTAAATGGAVIAVVLVSRRARLVRLQSDLLANVSHELRTPLSAIRMYAQTLQSGVLLQDPDRTRQSLDTIVRETEWLQATVERVLTWRALAKDRALLDPILGPVNGAVDEALERFRRMVSPGEVRLEVRLGSERAVDHDRESISGAVLNLLINAYKYTGDDKRIVVESRDVDGGVEVAVADNGAGIPDRELELIFDPFYRAESRPGSAAGAGLGLAIVRHLAQAHGGDIRVSSAVGRGSTFTLFLPGREGRR